MPAAPNESSVTYTEERPSQLVCMLSALLRRILRRGPQPQARHAAVDRQCSAGRGRGSRRGEIRDRGGDLVGGHETPERLACFGGGGHGKSQREHGALCPRRFRRRRSRRCSPGCPMIRRERRRLRPRPGARGIVRDVGARARELAHAVAPAAARSALQNVPSGYVYSLMEDACICAENPGALGAT